jgi:hypothetical protein
VVGADGDRFGVVAESPRQADAHRVYAVWEGVFFTRSQDGGQSWSTPLHLAGKFGSAVRRRSPSIRASGSILVSWIDAQDDPTDTTYRFYAVQSDDGGATFSPPFAGGSDIGDFDGAAVVRKGFGLAAFSSGGGYLTVARLALTPPPPPRRRAVRH